MELIGRRFGHIRVTEVIGQGGMGDVYGGYDEKLERRVALKVLNAGQRLDDEARERLLREARALSKLEHPNICRIHDYIETGDVDLLVLEYIDGRTLHDALSEKLPRGEKLRIAVAVAEVLVKAHRAGIVHRDLKPENVMLTRTGEVKVLDFGLARWLTRARSKPGDASSSARVQIVAPAAGAAVAIDETLVLPPEHAHRTPSGRREFLATAVGITLGTPIFMSPEQARGESLTPASDMFSFGLLLQVLFTGEDPHPMDLTAREVILRVARGETLPVQHAPGDVTALINRLKQFAPADRPTALETLDRLRMLQEKPQRIARRAIAASIALIAVIGGWRYTVDLKAERAIAVAARADAERRRAQAEDLIEFMLGDLRRKLEPVGRLDVLDDVGARALKYVGSLQTEAMGAEELARGAKALNQLVEVRLAQGKRDEALALAKRSLAMTTLALRKAPNDAETQLANATSHFWVGNVLRLQRDHAGALAQMKAYSSMTETLARTHPANETYQLERAYGHSVLGTMMEAEGKLRDALRHYIVTREVKMVRLVAAPADPVRKADLAVTDNKIGFVLHRLGRIREARQYFENELDAYRSLAAADPQNVKWQEREARSRSYMSLALESVGDYAGAIAHTEKELDIHARLAARDPENATWQRNVTMSHTRLASLRATAGDLAAADAEYDRAEAISRKVLWRESDANVRRRAEAAINIGRARILVARNDYTRAAAALQVARQALHQDRNDTETARTRAEVSLLEGDIRDARNDRAGAREAWTAAERLVASSPVAATDPFLLMLRAAALIRLGRASEAGPLLERTDAAGFKHPWLLTLRERMATRESTVTSRETRR